MHAGDLMIVSLCFINEMFHYFTLLITNASSVQKIIVTYAYQWFMCLILYFYNDRKIIYLEN